MILFFSTCLGHLNSTAQENKTTHDKTRILFIMDASKSMSGLWESKIKYNIASGILSEVLDSLKKVDNIQLALRVYGHQRNYPPQNCDDTKLEVPFADNNFERIKQRLKYIKPKGTSPIAKSLERAKSDFSACDECRNIIILITDGIEECGGDLCEISENLQKQGIALKPFIIGIGNDNKLDFDCAGTYINTPQPDDLTNALNVIITKVLSKTSMQVNLLDSNGEPKESNVNLEFIDSETAMVKYNFIHSLNNKGLPDTMYVDPLINYNIILGTIPSKTIHNVDLSLGKHNIIYTDCIRGKLKVSLTGNKPPDYNPRIIVKDNDGNTVNIQSLDEEISYLSDKYNLEILSLPITKLDDVEIEADKRNLVEVANPGILSIQKTIKGYGIIYQIIEGKQYRVVSINENSSRSESIYLQQGNYRLVFRPIHSNQSAFTQVKNFKIISGNTTKIKL